MFDTDGKVRWVPSGHLQAPAHRIVALQASIVPRLIRTCRPLWSKFVRNYEMTILIEWSTSVDFQGLIIIALVSDQKGGKKEVSDFLTDKQILFKSD